jgi:hypothetical protein
MRTSLFPARRLARRTTALLAASVAAVAAMTTYGLTSASAAPRSPHYNSKVFTFALKASSPAVAKCLPHAHGQAWITTTPENDIMKVTLWGMPPNSDFDLFVIQLPAKPFGVAWYQSDIHAGSTGSGTVTVRGVFDRETFSVSTGGTTTFAPTHQFHLGVWFNSPQLPFNIGCEPGKTTPVVTPFNGEQHAGIQVVNTAQFPNGAGPLSHVKR